jgi:peptidoglycan/xylan/chitin deacetylase (PgdA/CDA1 family)
MNCVTFHNVLAEPLDVFDRELWREHVHRFQRSLSWLQQRFDIVPLPHALSRLASGFCDERTLCLTFDDGYAGVFEQARPLLAERGLVGSVFILTEAGAPLPAERLLHFERLELGFRLTRRPTLAADFLGLGTLELSGAASAVKALKSVKRRLKVAPEPERRELTERVLEALEVTAHESEAYAKNSPRFAKLSQMQLQTLHAEGWTIGGHSRTHRTLSRLDAAELDDELCGNASDLQAALGVRGAPFAYPYGGSAHAGPREAAAARGAGFACAFTTLAGCNTPDTDCFSLRRMTMVDLQQSALGLDPERGRQLWSSG